MASGDGTLRSVWVSGAEFLAHLLDREPPQFFHPVPLERELPPVAVGALISVVIAFEDRDAEFHVHARVIDRRTGTVKHGLTLEVIPEERDRMEVILIAARGESFPYRRRRHERVACQLRCDLTGPDGRVWRGETTNVNEGGLHASVDHPLPAPDAIVAVRVEVEGHAWTVQGRIVDAIPEGPQRGVGVEFLFSSSEQRDAVRDDVATIRARHNRR